VDPERGEDVKIKDDSEYPDWLFTFDFSRPKPTWREMKPGTIEYYESLREEGIRREVTRRGKLKNAGVFDYISPL